MYDRIWRVLLNSLVFLVCQETPAIKDHQIHLILPLPNLKQIDFFICLIITNNCNVAIYDYVGTNPIIVFRDL